MRYPAGSTTSTFRLKAMLLYLRDRAGRSKAQQFAERIGGTGIVDDETRPLARALWGRAIAEFARAAGEPALHELGPFLTHAETLGAWSRVLRGASTPDDLFRQIGDRNEGLPGDTVWVTQNVGKRTWIARTELSGAETEPERRLLRAFLVSELAAIPTLLGLRSGRVTLVEDSPQGLAFRVEWSKPGWVSLWIGLGLAVLWLGIMWLGAGSPGHWLARLSSAGIEVLTWLPPFLFIGIGWITHRDSLRQAQTDFQRMRILALEREAALRQTRSKEISRPHEEPVIAGQYRVGVQLGVGATGAVWEANRLTDKARVALKLLRTAVVHDVRATDRLRREAEALGLSWHPHVVEVYDSGVLPSGVGFLVMECLTGETIAERLHRQKRVDSNEARTWGIQAADALLAVHSAGVVHRDIKPGNLYLHRPAGQRVSEPQRSLEPQRSSETGPRAPEMLKVIDFGVARVSWAETRLTRSGVRIGTLGYASPEQEEGSDVDGRSDIFGLGISLQEALTGVTPLAPQSNRDDALAALSPAWQEVLRRMTAADRDARYASAREVREAIEAIPVEESTTPGAPVAAADVASGAAE